MKSLWTDLSLKLEKQDKIQKELLMEITKQKFRNRLNYIRIPEILGSLVCVGYAMYLLSRFSDFELWYNQVFVLITIFILIALPAASLTALKGMRDLKIDSETPSAILEKFIKNKIRFWNIQRYGMILGAIIMITMLASLAELKGSDEVISNQKFWLIYVPGVFTLYFFFTRWALKKYRRVIDSSEKLLQELK